MDYLRDMNTDMPLCINVPIYGPIIHQSAVVESLLHHTVAPDLPVSRIFHFDVHPSVNFFFFILFFSYMYRPEMLVIISINRWIFPQVRTGLDTLLFNLFILGALKSCTGQIWRRRSSDLYVIEITSALPRGENQTAEKRLKTAKVNKILNLENKKRRLSSRMLLFVSTGC